MFKSADGGATWRRVLNRAGNLRTGAADLWIDRRNPNVVFAARRIKFV